MLVSQDHLGLFDTPPDRQEIRFSLMLVGLLFVALAILSVLPDVRLRQINAFIPMVDAIMFLGDLITATLLYAQASVFRSRALTVLASGYIFDCTDAHRARAHVSRRLCPGRIAGRRINTTAWIANFWRAAPPIAIILYVLLKRTETEQPVSKRPPARIAAAALPAMDRNQEPTAPDCDPLATGPRERPVGNQRRRGRHRTGENAAYLRGILHDQVHRHGPGPVALPDDRGRAWRASLGLGWRGIWRDLSSAAAAEQLARP